MDGTSEDNARKTTREIVFGTAPQEAPRTEGDPDLINDLSYHSLALMEMAFALEDEFGLPPIDQERAQAIRRLSDVEDYVLSQLRAKDDAAG